jgi:hypothetical protein
VLSRLARCAAKLPSRCHDEWYVGVVDVDMVVVVGSLEWWSCTKEFNI